MGKSSALENPFESMCKLASKEKWCWKIWCTTCGHMYFRYGFLELAMGKHPSNSDWLSGKRNHHRLRKELGPIPILGGFPLKHQKNLSFILQDANIVTISNSCGFPDWLGYTGLGLVYSENHEKNTRHITDSWIPQILQILPDNSYSTSMLQLTYSDKSKVLLWKDLELVEKDLIGGCT